MVGALPPTRDQVSIHASAREATYNLYPRFVAYLEFQSTPPRGRRRAERPTTTETAMFQHASRGRANGAPERGCPMVSIHASAREATRVAHSTSSRRSCFNPRLRAGGDPASEYQSPKAGTFQSTPPRGRRQCGCRAAATRDEFQSTPPRGRRPWSVRYHRREIKFQSTPPRGRRRERWSGGEGLDLVSIHASAREATTPAN